MPETKILDKFKIKEEGVFNFDDLYKMMFRWFTFNGYGFSEVEYRKFGQGDHIEIIWKADKVLDHYAKIEIEINILILGLQKIEIDVEGAKQKSQKGTLEMQFNVNLITNYKKNLKPWMEKLYEGMIVKSRINDYEEHVAAEAREMIGEIKSFLEINQF